MSLSVEIQKSFKGFSLDVAFEAGSEVLGLLGESGCGKTLTMRCIAGIETPDSGKIVVNDRVFFDKASGKKAKVNLSVQERKTALLFQNYMLFPNMTVAQNVGAGIGKDVSNEQRNHLVEEELTRFSISEFKDRYPSQLSGGQQQRVALARMLAAKPGILMLDEPFSALDAHLKGILEQNLTGLFEMFFGTVLYVSHDIDEALRFCDRIAVIDGGRIMELSSGDDLVNSPKSVASIKLSGCKNITTAQYVDEHKVYLPKWKVNVECDQVVSQDVTHLGVRAFMLQRVNEADKDRLNNVFKVSCDRVSDSRFERTVLLGFVDGADKSGKAKYVDSEMSFLDEHLFWRVDKLYVDEKMLPNRDDELYIRIPSDKIYLVSK